MDYSRDKYLEQLSKAFPLRTDLVKEIVLLESVLSLPKGAELYISDVHGEYEAFQHMLRNGSGLIKQRLDKLFKDKLSENEIRSFATLIYYPEEKLKILKSVQQDADEFYKGVVDRLVYTARSFASIFGERKLNRLLVDNYSDIISELIRTDNSHKIRKRYHQQIVQSFINTGEADQLIIELCEFIQSLAVHKIHVIGDIYDRGPAAENIMDELIKYHSVDIQWGNHDIVWMGAAAGSLACIANVIRLSLRYGNTSTLETGYGIKLISLASFALEHYKSDESAVFNPRIKPEELINESEKWLHMIMHKAISIIQFKLEDQLLERNEGFHMNTHFRLRDADFNDYSVKIRGKRYELVDKFFPTIDPKQPNKLTKGESDLMNELLRSFTTSERLRKHVNFLYQQGSFYKKENGCLLYHGSIPVDKYGDLKVVELNGERHKGKKYLEWLESKSREAYFLDDDHPEKQKALDLMWYLWCGPESPLFGKDKMRTFERYFIKAKSTHVEKKSFYYKFRDNEETCKKILKDFGLNPTKSIILNGHVPVVAKEGESPVKANGKLFVIDGGFAKAYQDHTGIAGYSFIFDHKCKQLVAHEAFESIEKAIREEIDIKYDKTVYAPSSSNLTVKDTDDGKELVTYINDLKELLEYYKRGRFTK